MHTILVRNPLLTPLLFNYLLIFFSIIVLYVVLIVISFSYDCNLDYLVPIYIYIYIFIFVGQYKNQFLAAYFTLLKECKMNEMNE